MMLEKKRNKSKSIIDKTEMYYRNHPSKGKSLVFSEPLKKSEIIRNKSVGASFWARNLEINDKKNELAKFTLHKNEAILKLHTC